MSSEHHIAVRCNRRFGVQNRLCEVFEEATEALLPNSGRPSDSTDRGTRPNNKRYALVRCSTVGQRAQPAPVRPGLLECGRLVSRAASTLLLSDGKRLGLAYAKGPLTRDGDLSGSLIFGVG